MEIFGQNFCFKQGLKISKRFFRKTSLGQIQF